MRVASMVVIWGLGLALGLPKHKEREDGTHKEQKQASNLDTEGPIEDKEVNQVATFSRQAEAKVKDDLVQEPSFDVVKGRRKRSLGGFGSFSQRGHNPGHPPPYGQGIGGYPFHPGGGSISGPHPTGPPPAWDDPFWNDYGPTGPGLQPGGPGIQWKNGLPGAIKYRGPSNWPYDHTWMTKK